MYLPSSTNRSRHAYAYHLFTPRISRPSSRTTDARPSRIRLAILGGNRFVKGNETWLPLYEAKVANQFDHRWAKIKGENLKQFLIDEKSTPDEYVIPRYWLNDKIIADKWNAKPRRQWMCTYRRIARSTDFHTMISMVLPYCAPNDKLPLIDMELEESVRKCLLVANLNSLVPDDVARTKVGGTQIDQHLSKQLAILPPLLYEKHSNWAEMKECAVGDWLLLRVLELTYTAWYLQAFAQDCGYHDPPFR